MRRLKTHNKNKVLFALKINTQQKNKKRYSETDYTVAVDKNDNHNLA